MNKLNSEPVVLRRANRFTPEELARFGGKVDRELVRKIVRLRRERHNDGYGVTK